VRPSHLDAIEKERFADLPAPVFIRGFLREYSRCLGLPVDEVTRLYMQRYQDWRESGRHPGDSGLGSSSLS
jgi:cytoskeletal protein RodZ